MTNEELSEKLDSISITDVGFRFSVPAKIRSMSSLRSGPNPWNLIPWVELDIGGTKVKIRPRDYRGDNAFIQIRRRILREIKVGKTSALHDKTVNLNHLRRDPAMASMKNLISKITERTEILDEEEGPSVQELRDRTERILRSREKADLEDDIRRSKIRIRTELMGNSSAMTEEEVIGIWRECQVKMVMES